MKKPIFIFLVATLISCTPDVAQKEEETTCNCKIIEEESVNSGAWHATGNIFPSNYIDCSNNNIVVPGSIFYYTNMYGQNVRVRKKIVCE